MSTASPQASPRRRRKPARVVLLRQVGEGTPVHRLWAGTKLVAVAAISVTLSLVPLWGATGIFAAVLLGTAMLARIPRSALPRPPRWFWIVFALSALLTALSGGRPVVVVAGEPLGLGGIEGFARFSAVGIELLAFCAMVGWTTPLGEVAPALTKLFRPLRIFRLPAEEWAITVALCIRAMPLLMQELRTLLAARKLRPRRVAPPGQRLQYYFDELVDLLVAVLAVSIRRAGELAEAMTARGGTGRLTTTTSSPRRADLVALSVVALSCVAVWFLPGA